MVNTKMLVTSINAEIGEAYAAVSKIESRMQDYVSAYLEEIENDDEQDFNTEVLNSHLLNIYRSLLLAADASHSPSLASSLEMDFRAHRKKGLANLQLLPYIGEFECEALTTLHSYYRSLASALEVTDGASEFHDRLDTLKRLLANTHFHLSERMITPTREQDLQNCLSQALRHTFPDLRERERISQTSKGYEADLAIPSLKALVELKFADSKTEIKKGIGEIYTDMYGYNGNSAWENFFALVYCTRPFLTYEQIQEEWRRVGVPTTWKLIVVFGPGERKKTS